MQTKRFMREDLHAMIKCLHDDEVIGFRTDTVMGLIAKSTSEVSKENLMLAKDRPQEKLFPIMVSSIEMMKSVANLTDKSQSIVEKYLPGPLTVILQLKADSGVKLDSDTVAVRIVEDELLIELVEKLGVPIFLTSANMSGANTTMKADEVLEIFDGKIAGVYMQDAPGYEASTIVDLVSDNMKILRAGKITIEQLEED